MGERKILDMRGYDTESRVWWGHSKSEGPVKHPDGDAKPTIWYEVRFGETNGNSPVSQGNLKM